MSNALAIIRSLVIYSLCLPLAIFLGYLLAMPMDTFSLTVVLVAALLPLLPALLRWHHLLVFACWNTPIMLFFLPGRPNLWMFMVFISFTLSILQHVLNRNIKFISVPSITRPLIFLTIVILVTAKLTGGFGSRLMGSDSFGGRRYLMLLASIMGYFAMACYRVPEGRGPAYLAFYYLGALTSIVGSLGPLFVGHGFYFLFALFPVDTLENLFNGGESIDFASRLVGLTIASVGAISFMFARHGVRGIFNFGERWSFLPVRFQGGFGFNQPWRFILFVSMIWICLMGGYRAHAILILCAFVVQFYLEGLFRTQLLPAMVLSSVLIFALCLPFTEKLPITVQRSLSFLPVKLDPVARYAADTSSEWRIQMWKTVLPQVSQYLILGKGYSFSGNDLQTVTDNAQRSGASDAEGSMLAGDYHNGPLTVIIPLGIFGVIGFLWFLAAGFRVLLYNFRYGDPELRQINTFLLAAFAIRAVFFMTIFGSFHGELSIFTGLLGLSVSINGGMRRPAPVPVEKPAFGPLKLTRATR